MHGKGCLVGPGQGLVRLDEKNALGQPGDDLLQVPMLCSLLRNARVRFFLTLVENTLGSRPDPSCYGVRSVSIDSGWPVVLPQSTMFPRGGMLPCMGGFSVKRNFFFFFFFF